MMLRLNYPDVDEEELGEIGKVLESGYLTQGPRVEEFERSLASFVGSRYAFAMSSCTTALHLALVVLGVGPGDEVIVADFTFPATGNVVIQQGAVPVLADICLDTYTVDPAAVAANITARTRAIIAVDTFGCAADMDALRDAAQGIAIIEDAACALGATYHHRQCGSLSALGCFSFHPRKVITTGEGGMITTGDDELASRIRLLRSHGGVREGSWYRYEEAGFNYRLSDIQGAMGVVQMRKLPHLLERKRALAAGLRERLSGIDGVHLPQEPPWGEHGYQSFVVRLAEGIDRGRVVRSMRDQGVEATLGTYALHDQPVYQRRFGYRTGQLPRSHEAFRTTVTLPLYPRMNEADLDIVAKALGRAVAGAAHRDGGA